MKIVEVRVYQFNELSDDAKEKARQWFRDRALDYDWWEGIYDDAATIGLKIREFDLDGNRHAAGKFIMSGYEVSEKIIQEHGKDYETYKTAVTFKKEYDAILEDDDKVNKLTDQFLKSLLEDYSIMLQHEYEYLLSDKSVDETIEANQYTFTENGERF
jgi:phytoene dehydrogenase-like protein